MVQIKHMFDLEERAVQTQRLSKRQQQIYDFICSEVASKGYPPSVREIADAVGLRSPSTVHVHLQVLEDRGYIKRNLSKSRALEVVHTQDAEAFDDVKETPASDTNMVRLPLLGRVAAGEPILEQYQFFVSDRAENFTRFAKAILPKEVKDTKQINIEEY